MSSIKLVPFDPDDSIQVEELRRQRVLCGWNVDKVDKWREYGRQGLKALFWVFPADDQESRAKWTSDMPQVDMCNLSPKKEGPPPNPNFRPLGQGSLDWYDDMGDERLVCRDKKPRRIQISNLFTLKHLAGRGLGNMILAELESLASKPPFDADYVTLNTIDRDLAVDPRHAKRFGWHYDADARVNQDWYVRKGYTVFERMVPRYEEKDLEGKLYMHGAAYLEKRIK
ncbi:hypothetical protein OIV83_000564 [Microbotryomycetes sp. JL201]|nr:hypothetical protein OIV83_000564 [Microbotryomycetes sp. JL201]